MKRLNSAMPLALATLVACAQSAIEAARAQDVTVVNARIVVGDGPVIANGYITVAGGKIVTVAPGRPPRIVGSLIDAAGMTALPGFIDGHKHLNTSPEAEKEQMEDLIENGFTTVLSALGPADSNLALAQKIDSGQINGPRVIASGRVDLHGSPGEARAAIRAMAARGIKFTGEMPVTPEPGPTAQELAVLKAAVDEGRKGGVEILVHAVSTPAMVAVSEAGVHREVHLPNKDFMSYDDAARIAGTGTYVLDTVSYGAPIIDVFQQDDQPRFRTGLEWPESIAGANRDAQGRATGTEAAYSMMNARRIWDATHGRGLGYGSDQNYPVRDVLEHELKSLMVMLSVPDVIRVLTINTAAFMNMQNEIGTLEPLKRADIVLVEGDPFEDFNDLLKTRVVLKDGKVVVDKRAAGAGRTAPGAPAAAGASSATAAGAAAGSAPRVGTLTAAVARPDQKPVTNCKGLSGARLAGARVIAAAQMPAISIERAASPAGDRPTRTLALQANCVVQVRLRRAHGTDVRLTVWLPEIEWNGNFLLLGDGSPIAMEALESALLRGYAVASASMGLPGARARAQQRVELANRAVHEWDETSKALVKAYYGAKPRYAYWISAAASPGEQPLDQLQMHPEDFDGVVFGGAPGSQTDAASTAAATAAATAGNAPTGTPDLAAFARRGAKIVEYESGGGASAYRRLAARSGGVAETRSFYRLFILPSPRGRDRYRADWLTVLDEWVQRARAPEEVLAEHIPPPDAQLRPPGALVFEPQYGARTLCAYPEVARLQSGQGETPVDWLCLPAPAGTTAQN